MIHRTQKHRHVLTGHEDTSIFLDALQSSIPALPLCKGDEGSGSCNCDVAWVRSASVPEVHHGLKRSHIRPSFFSRQLRPPRQIWNTNTIMPPFDEHELRRRVTVPMPPTRDNDNYSMPASKLKDAKRRLVGDTDLVSWNGGIPSDMNEEYAVDMHRTKSPDPTEEQTKSPLLTQQPTSKRLKEHVARRARKRQFQTLRFWLGLKPDARIKQHHYGSEQLLWSRIRAVMQEPFSEFLGIMVFTMIQQGGVAQATLCASSSSAPGGDGYGSYLTVPFW